MFVIENTLKVKKGFSDRVAAKMAHMGQIEKVPGFLDMNLLKKRGKKEEEYDILLIWSKWESQQAHHSWTSSEMFRKTHDGVRSDYILDSQIAFYDVIGGREAVDQNHNAM
ncbi:antibiotic biosynthesis monooxygenase [Halalkalibacter oceani]|uniref:Antibiotic biosynthesis monooxygenase n=1 Tax=Halalkalibacter oceani TaxID=1653776 RepID=A0A9X2DQ17_9BACI|nr:antibiotic biosynthesis monooxygenase [Halalkalibacter oceani]MCM3714045.1 antibiotic biosynthesis monooxygenase [Halalkalibacter oceani]